MNDKQFEVLSKKLDWLIKVTGMAACRGLPPDEQAWILYCAGLPSSDIAELLGSNTNAVDQALHRTENEGRKDSLSNTQLSDRQIGCEVESD